MKDTDQSFLVRVNPRGSQAIPWETQVKNEQEAMAWHCLLVGQEVV